MPLEPLGALFYPRLERVLEKVPTSAEERPRLLGACAKFLDLVVTWNNRIDLTAARNPDELVDSTFADSATLASRSSSKPERWVDIGSGVGAPGVGLALFLPQVSVKLVEPRQKRVAFLRTALVTLARPGLEVVRARSEDLEEASADVAVSRATLPPEQWLAEGTRLAPRVWVLLAREAPPAMAGWLVEEDVEYEWPLTGARRRAVRYAQSGVPPVQTMGLHRESD